MTQYIDKSAVTVEIEKLDEFYHLSKDAGGQAFIESLLSFLDAPEVKDVDLEKEITNWWDDRYKKLNNDYEFRKYNGHYMENSTIISLVRHFYELGLKAQEGE